MLAPDVPISLFDPESHGNVLGALESALTNRHATDVAMCGQTRGACRIDVFDRREQHGCMVVVVSSTTKAFVPRTTELLEVTTRRSVTTMDASRRLLSADDGFEKLFGYAPEDAIGQPATTVVHPDDIDRANKSWAEVFKGRGAQSRTRVRVQHRNGRWIWLEVTRTNMLHTDEPHIRTVTLDISSEMAAHLELERQEALIHKLAEATGIAVLHVDGQGHVELANDRWADITGVTPTRNLDDFILAAFDRPVGICEKLRAARIAGTDVSAIVHFSSPILGPRTGRLLQQVIQTAGEVERFSGVLLTLADVTESLTANQEIEKLDRIDAITKLHNERGVSEQVRAMLFETTDYELPLQLLHFRLDDASQSGDLVLREVAQCLRQATQPQDLVGRIAADEFVVVLRGIAAEYAERTTTRIQGQILTMVGVSTTLGRSIAAPGDDYQSLVKRASTTAALGVTATSTAAST